MDDVVPRRFGRGCAAGLLVSGSLLLGAHAVLAQDSPNAAQDSPSGPATPSAIAGAGQTDILGIWQGVLMPPDAPKGTRVVIKITKGADGTYKGAAYNADTGTPPLTFSTVTLQDMNVKLTSVPNSIEGKLSADGKTIDGIWVGNPTPVAISLTRTEPDAAWAIPEPPKPMSPDADPNFDVVTIKPGQPGRPGKGMRCCGRHFLATNTNLNDLLAIAYGLHPKQIIGAPDWAATELFDIDGIPDVPGQPSPKQISVLVQKLLADRFQLKFHHETRELAVYAIHVVSTGAKMNKSTSGPTDPQGFGGIGDLLVRNMSMKDFAWAMQSYVMDKPVVDQTGLTDRYDFTLKFTPDDSQYGQSRGTNGPITPPAGDNPNAPPSLYTAMQEQLGLKIESGRAMDDVIVIDHVEKPLPN